jgi:hypothetical protein
LANTARRGSTLENRAKGQLEAAGYTVMRSAASAGPLDLLAWGDEGCRGIQVKSGGRAWSNVTESRSRVKASLSAVARPSNMTYELWIWYERKWLKYTLVQGEWKEYGNGRKV